MQTWSSPTTQQSQHKICAKDGAKKPKLLTDGNTLIAQVIKMKKDVKTFSTKKGVSVL